MLRAIRSRVFLFLIVGLLPALGGCGLGSAPGGGHGEGPGHRAQALALTPYQELNLGEQAYEEVLKKNRVVRDGPDVHKVREIGERIARASEIEPLQREINLRIKGYTFKWAFNVLESDQVNAFCLPGGKVAVYTGLLKLARQDGRLNEDELATVMAHEIAHALAHHSSERLARQQKFQTAMEALNGAMGALEPQQRKQLIGLLGAGASMGGMAYDRQQESEADHIGLFLMTFAGYDPKQAITFWEKMAALSAKQGHMPEVLSDHPSDRRRIAQIKQWVPYADNALRAYKAHRIAGP